MVQAIGDIHFMGYIHRDIKPKNMCIVQDQDNEGVLQLKLIDFGISKNFVDLNKTHIKQPFGVPFCGTAEFTSLAAHNGLGHSRKDDLESIGLLIIFFLNGGTLPWYNKFDKDKHKKIQQSMNNTTLADLCIKGPKEIRLFMKYCRELDFEQEPNYQYLKDLLQ